MIDIVEKLKLIASAASYANGTDTPLGEQVRGAAVEIERLRNALERIIATDRITVFSIGKPTDGGDGPSARIARQALPSTECETP